MDQKLLKDIIEWDVKNWSKALVFWSKNINLKSKKHTCLEVGARRGGLSLWLAINGNDVICSDRESPEAEATKVHSKYRCLDKIVYRSIDATDIPYDNEFDIVIFKSILGGVSAGGRDELKKKAIDQIYNSLKPNGKLLFAENLDASFIHRYIRKRFVPWGREWNYLKYDEIDSLFKSFESVNYTTLGFLGLFARKEKHRNILASVDTMIRPFIPKKNRYIVFGIAEKGNKKNENI